jgi:D-3-phosphoglycerate dehydrogenase
VSDHSKPLTVALLKGLLDPIADTPVNYINATLLAKQRGISVSETSGLARPRYANLLSCRVAWDGGAHLIAGSLLGHELPRVVQVDDFVIDAQPEGTILVMESMDVPGVIGRVGTMLGEHAINIGEWRLGRVAPRHQVLSFINLDSVASPEVLASLAQLEGVVRVRQVKV